MYGTRAQCTPLLPLKWYLQVDGIATEEIAAKSALACTAMLGFYE